MRYLYGDSVPFPLHHDFLAALEVFVTQAARIVRLDGEGRAMRKSADEGALQRSHAVDQLEAFHREAVGALRDGSTNVTAPLVLEYVAQISDLAQRVVDDARRGAVATSEREQQAARAETDRRRAEIRDALEKMLVAVRLPVDETRITAQLTDSHNEMSAVFVHDGELVSTFTLDPLDEWRAPRRVTDFAQGVSLPVGVRRSMFKKGVAAETIALDEYVISGFELRDDRAEIRMRKKIEQPDSLVFAVRRIDDRLTAEVHYPSDAEAEGGLPAVLDQTSASQMERLWQLLRTAVAPMLQRKRRMVQLLLGGRDVADGDLSSAVVALVVRVIAPTVGEIARRSPNVHELSLKIENDTGRREEIYLRKAQLVSVLSSVAPTERGVFEPLGLIASGDPRLAAESLPDDLLQPG
jgi:hypothetical protein